MPPNGSGRMSRPGHKLADGIRSVCTGWAASGLRCAVCGLTLGEGGVMEHVEGSGVLGADRVRQANRH